jgi:hypothetical protein
VSVYYSFNVDAHEKAPWQRSKMEIFKKFYQDPQKPRWIPRLEIRLCL